MRKTLFITMLAAALLGGQVFAEFTGTTIEGYEGVDYDYYFGKYSATGSVSGGDVTIKADPNGEVPYSAKVYGGYTNGMDTGDSASNNKVTMTGGEVYNVFGGCGYDSAYGNTVIMTGGYCNEIWGGYCWQEDVTLSNNVVIISGNAACGYAAGAVEGDATNNSVHLVGKGAVDVAIKDGQGVIGHYSGGNGITISIIEGTGGRGTTSGNSINIYGTGITAYCVQNMQILTFNITNGQLTGATRGEIMLNLPDPEDLMPLNLEGVELQVNDIDVASWTPGTTITLVQSAPGIEGFTEPQDVEIKRGDEVTATGTLQLSDDATTLVLTNIQGVTPVPPPPPVPAAEADALDVTLVNSLWASSAYVREFVRLSGAQGYALKSGDTAVWGGGFGTFMHATGDRGFKSDGGGYGIGVNHAFSANTQAGISFGQGFGSYHNSGVDGATVHQRAILAAATASTRMGKDFSLGGHLAYGSVRNRADCRLDGATERARWNDNVFNLGVQAAYDFHVTDATAITPFLGLDWAYGAQESINEVGS